MHTYNNGCKGAGICWMGHFPTLLTSVVSKIFQGQGKLYESVRGRTPISYNSSCVPPNFYNAAIRALITSRKHAKKVCYQTRKSFLLSIIKVTGWLPLTSYYGTYVKGQILGCNTIKKALNGPLAILQGSGSDNIFIPECVLEFLYYLVMNNQKDIIHHNKNRINTLNDKTNRTVHFVRVMCTLTLKSKINAIQVRGLNMWYK